jgi:hypothetical protein
MVDQSELLTDLGSYLKAQREIAKLALRHLARMTRVSDSYLSQLERVLRVGHRGRVRAHVRDARRLLLRHRPSPPPGGPRGPHRVRGRPATTGHAPRS